MKNQLALLVGLIVACVLIVQMFSFQVRYDEVAVRAQFEAADENDLITEPGLKFKYPWPIQKVYTYSKKLQLLDADLRQLQTNDNKTIIVRLYLAWRIDNPLAFYRTHRSIDVAEKDLEPRVMALDGVLSKFNFEDFVNSNAEKIKLNEIESQCAKQLSQSLVNQNFGVKIEHVGIRQILLPEQTTPTVFEAMRTKRERLAEKARAEGDAEALTITNRATSVSDRILAFAERRAQAIRDEGNREAEAYFTSFREDEQFAIFLRQIEALKATLDHNTTFILDANRHWFLQPLTEDVRGRGTTNEHK